MQTLIQILFIILLAYFFAFIVRLILSIFKFRQNRFTELLCKITDPVIDFFKDKVPMKIGPFEISSILPVIAMYFILKFLSDITNGYSIIDINYLLYFVFYIAKTCYDIILLIAIICIILIMLSNNRIFRINNSLINYARSVLNPIIIFMRKNIKFQFLNSENRYYALLLIFTISAWIFGGLILQFFISMFDANVSGKIKFDK